LFNHSAQHISATEKPSDYVAHIARANEFKSIADQLRTILEIF